MVWRRNVIQRTNWRVRTRQHARFMSAWSAWSALEKEVASQSSETTLWASQPVMHGVNALGEATGLPWWATIVLFGVGVRTAMLPVTLKAVSASTGAVSIWKQINAENRVDPPQSSRSVIEFLRKYHTIRKQNNITHPLWIIASPLLQLPVFITAMTTVRTMCLIPYTEELKTGGIAWFTDLTQAAVRFGEVFEAPMGPYGAILPAVIAVTMHANIATAFPDRPTNQGNPVASWLISKVRLALEWAVVPLFITALHLPQGALCYWATSSGYGLIQQHIVKAVGRRSPGGRQTVITTGQPPPPSSSAGKTVDGMFLQAAELRANGDFVGAASMLKNIITLEPQNARAHFALGQTLSGCKQWEEAAQAYLSAAKLEKDATQRGRVWFGVGVALHQNKDQQSKKNSEISALDAFLKAASPQSDTATRVRGTIAAAAIHEKAGRLDEAVRLLRLASELEPKVKDIYLKPLEDKIAEKDGTKVDDRG